MIEQINGLFSEIKQTTATNAEELEALRLKYLSKKGILNACGDAQQKDLL